MIKYHRPPNWWNTIEYCIAMSTIYYHKFLMVFQMKLITYRTQKRNIILLRSSFRFSHRSAERARFKSTRNCKCIYRSVFPSIFFPIKFQLNQNSIYWINLLEFLHLIGQTNDGGTQFDFVDFSANYRMVLNN